MSISSRQLMAVAIAFFSGIVGGAGGLALLGRTRPAPIYITPPAPTPTAVPTATPGPIRVHVNGAVARPAVYGLAPGSLVQDAIRAAGGFGDDANQAAINLAAGLADGALVYVPARDEAAAAESVGLVQGSASGVQGAGAAAAMVNINAATAAELETLPGIGPSTAEKIVSYRAQEGPFASIEAIMNVTGIGPARFEQIKDAITVGNGATVE